MTEQIDEMFTRAVEQMWALETTLGDSPPEAEVDPRQLQVFDAQLGSRHLDLAARWLRGQGKGYYTIGSCGHEGNAAVAAALRPTDPALLHYRSGAFFLERARQGGVSTALRDVLLGVVAAAEDPISGGRHKVFGSKALAVIPQTSTIASHLPGRWVLPSRSNARESLGFLASGHQMRSRCAASVTPPQTTPRPPVPSTLLSTPATKSCQCPYCSSARTTAWASVSALPADGLRTATGTDPGWSTSRQTDVT
jgi:hypothetical protein